MIHIKCKNFPDDCSSDSLGTESQKTGFCAQCREVGEDKSEASTEELSSYITSKGKRTLEEIAIEVGLRKLGCTMSCWDNMSRSEVPAHIGSIEAFSIDIGCQCSGSVKTNQKKEIIQAAFPFEAKWVNSNANPGQKVSFTELSDRGFEHKSFPGSGQYFPNNKKRNDFTLSNPMLSGIISKEPIHPHTPSEKPQCVCPEKWNDKSFFEHQTLCAWMVWRGK